MLNSDFNIVNMKKNLLEKKAEDFCSKNRFQLTTPRKYVLKIVIASRKPIKAYEILKKLGKILVNPKPPTVYRAIEFWQKNNFIHRIESLNSYYACEAEHLHSGSQFLICDDCGKVIESHICEIPKVITDKLKNKTFTPNRWNLEISGSCNECS